MPIFRTANNEILLKIWLLVPYKSRSPSDNESQVRGTLLFPQAWRALPIVCALTVCAQFICITLFLLSVQDGSYRSIVDDLFGPSNVARDDYQPLIGILYALTAIAIFMPIAFLGWLGRHTSCRANEVRVLRGPSILYHFSCLICGTFIFCGFLYASTKGVQPGPFFVIGMMGMAAYSLIQIASIFETLRILEE